MPETSTSAASKPHANIKSKTKPRVEPDQHTTVSPALQRAVNAYVKADASVQSKLWPLVMEALDLLDEPMKCEDVIVQFRMAFALAHRIKPNEYEKNIEYQRFRHTSLNVTRVAGLGREMVEKNHKAGIGFWKLLDHANGKAAKEGDFGLDSDKAKAKKSKTAANAKRKGNPTAEEEEDEEAESEPEAKSGNVKIPKATPEWRERFRYIVQHEQKAFIEEVEFCVNRGWLPDQILPIIKEYLEGN